MTHRLRTTDLDHYTEKSHCCMGSPNLTSTFVRVECNTSRRESLGLAYKANSIHSYLSLAYAIEVTEMMKKKIHTSEMYSLA